MQDHELDATLGDTKVTDDQRATLFAVADLIVSRYPDDKEASETAFAAALAVVLGDDTIEDLGSVWKAAKVAERTAMESLTGAIIAAAQDTSEVQVAARAGVDRMTVRKALGKK